MRFQGVSSGDQHDEVNDNECSNVPTVLQDAEVLVDNTDLGGKDQPYNAMMDPQDNDISAFNLNIEHQHSPAPEPGPLHSSHHRQVFNIGPESESEPEEEMEIEQDGGTYIWFQPDTLSESEGANEGVDEGTDEGADEDEEIPATDFEDPSVTQGEEACKLVVAQKLDDLGSSVLSIADRDNIKAMALKIRNQLTRNTFKGVQKLTHGHMTIGSEYVAGRVLERVSELSIQIYDCCVNSCVCFMGEFESLTACPLCGEPRHDKRNKVRNQF